MHGGRDAQHQGNTRRSPQPRLVRCIWLLGCYDAVRLRCRAHPHAALPRPSCHAAPPRPAAAVDGVPAPLPGFRRAPRW
eukprot:scaffold134525_cov121-Phaeocystis_antarctica.AAC.1